MVRIVQRSNRPPLMTCLIVVFAFVAVGIMTIAGIVIALVFLSADSSDSSPTENSSSVGSPPPNAGADGGSTTAPVSGGWSSGG
ncbi:MULTISPECIES: hypothetical protein [unclassified Brevibacterium]|uniref:hypothetical protein n=1 Tax=unclassified Brevibacterium TaxID=2614124 RepID=UPI0010920F64|nr:hypothetical protein [Brevibacterium sp. S22]